MGNFSKDPEAELQSALDKGYCKVRFQQGKPILDHELNLLGDLAGSQRLAGHHIGNGIPAGDNGFQITDLDTVANDFIISAGRCLVEGYEVVLTEDTTYKTQPHKESLSALPTGLSNVYLRVFQSEVTGAHDPGLNNADEGDVGLETTVRQKIEWEVLVTKSVISLPDHLLLAVINKGSGSVEDRRRKGLTLSSICDEISLARGNRNRLSERLDESLRDDGKLKQDSVGTIQIAGNAVNSSKIADNSVTLTKLHTSSNSGQFSILPNGSVIVNLGTTRRNEHAFYLISVSLVHIPNTNGRIEWSRRVQRINDTQLRQVLFIDNKWPVPVTVSWKVLRIL